MLKQFKPFEDSIYDKALRQALPGFAPIWYCNAIYSVKDKRRAIEFSARKIVLKGDLAYINKTQKTAIARAHFSDQSDAKKKAHVFDLEKVLIKSIEIIKFMGYGLK